MDEKIDKLNAKIGKILGKRNNKNTNISNNGSLKPKDDEDIGELAYIIMTLASLLLLWCATGLYYINDGSCGVIYKQGKMSESIVGPKFGITLPYPFSTIDIVDISTSNMLPLTDNSDNNFILLSKDMLNVSSTVQFSYQIMNALKYNSNFISNDDNLENMVRWNIQSTLHAYIQNSTYTELHTSNLTLLSNKIKDTVNENIDKYGVSVVKINISKLFNIANTYDNTAIYASPMANESIGSELIGEAQLYQKNKLATATVNITKFNTLLPQYLDNQQATVSQMYTDALNQIPLTNNVDKYPLLSMSLSELINLNKTKIVDESNDSTITNDVRELNRSVVRNRNSDGHDE